MLNIFFSDADPSNYMSYYKRATVFLALSRSRPALADLDKVIQLKNDFMAVSLLVLMENWGCNSDGNFPVKI